ncbi:ECF subfamily RNA polymerase sigma-24 subunit [Salinisphaera sp. PC39]|uniref:sigma-70 family RNA polymerase sigma factor n=1 Tax=Salinisphaera sp. PC39 TaxID=1304156 RepID=UPI00334016F6
MGEREDDDELVARVAQGDADAFEVLADRHADRVFALSRRILGNDADAEDAAQEVFVRLWTRADRYRPGRARFTTWLYRVTTNTCLNMRRGTVEAPMPDSPPEQAAPDGDPETAAEAALQRERLTKAIDGLPANQRTAVSLSLQREFSNREAAAAMTISVKALEALLVRARRSLRAALAGARDGG